MKSGNPSAYADHGAKSNRFFLKDKVEQHATSGARPILSERGFFYC
ncbi:hypothetical protein JOC27_002198 [Sporolactobacillus spathodeae]|uniref:Uncharacterized protein n=1 Tax=Sporolactobacillus spathodeae TaxID=1465502 RepID=A0ABS2QAY0_9BACL|nr:hypothetical protein [Sporolactobacillus spathodeae]